MKPAAADHPSEDRLVDLVAGLLPDDDRARSLAHLKRCAACEERLAVYAAEREWLAAGTVRGTPYPLGRWAARIAGVAAAAVLALWVLLPGRAPGGSVEADAWLPLDDRQIVLRSDTASGSTAELERALEAYGERDASRAADWLLAARVPDSHTALRDLYLASALALDGRCAEATSRLDGLRVDTLPEPWRRRARWVEYTVWRATGRREGVHERLVALAAAGDEIGARARRELARRATEP